MVSIDSSQVIPYRRKHAATQEAAPWPSGWWILPGLLFGAASWAFIVIGIWRLLT